MHIKKQRKKLISTALALILLIPLIPINAATAKDDEVNVNLRSLSQPEIDPSINTKSDKTIKVIVEFTTDPVVVQRLFRQKRFDKAEDSVQQALKKFRKGLTEINVSANITTTYKTVFSGAAVEMRANDVPKLKKVAGVRAVHANNRVEAIPVTKSKVITPYTEESTAFIGADEYWKRGFEGKGIKIGVIDTGIDYHHPDLKKAYKGGYDFVDNDDDPYEGNETVNTTHGTHVSGIIAGRGKPEKGGVRGVAPKSDLYVYRVLGPEGGWDEWVIAGIERAVEDGVDVVNLSLGNHINDADAPTSRAVNNAMLAGVITVVANGNTGMSGLKSVGAPATAALGISVGASTPPIHSYRFTGQASATGTKEYSLLWMMQEKPQNLKSLFKGKEIVYLGLGRPEDFDGVNVKNKLVLVKRGVTHFEEVNARAAEAGAAGVVIFNSDGYNEHINRPAPLPDGIPTFDMRGDDGRELAAALAERSNKKPRTFKLTDELTETYPGDELADFSSRGPVVTNMEIKPDVVAPGVHIRSTVPSFGGNDKKAYAYYDGTSMAAPHIAGMAALIKQARPEFDPFDVKTALMNTALQIAPKEQGAYRVLDIGAGRVQGLEILRTPALAQVPHTAEYTKDSLDDDKHQSVEHLTGAIHFGEIRELDGKGQQVLLKNVSDQDVTYRVSYDIHHFLPRSGSPGNSDVNSIHMTFDQKEVTVPAGGSESLTAHLRVNRAVDEGFYEGYVRLTPVDGTHPGIHIPYIAYNNAQLVEGIREISADPRSLSLNGDGINETTTIQYELTEDMTDAILYLQDVARGQLAGVIKTMEGDELQKGKKHTFTWDGRYVERETGEVKTVTTGWYKLELVAHDAFHNEHKLGLQTFIANEATSIEVDQLGADGRIATEDNSITGFLSSPLVEMIRGMFFNDPYLAEFLSMEYKIYAGGELQSSGWVELTTDGAPDDKLKFHLKDKLPPGESKLVLNVSDKAGNVNEVEYDAVYDVDTSISGDDVAVGDELKLTLSVHQVEKLVAGEFKLDYLSDVFTYDRVEVTEEFRSLAPNTVTTSFVDGEKWTDEDGREHHWIQVGGALSKDFGYGHPVSGATGNIPIVHVYFTASKDVRNLGSYPFAITTSQYIDQSLSKKTLRGSTAEVEVYTEPTTLSGRVNLEAYLDKNGDLRNDIDYRDTRSYIRVWDAETGEELLPLDGYRTDLSTNLNDDGTFSIKGLKPGKKYDVEFVYPGHFAGVAKEIETSTPDEAGNAVPVHNVTIDFGLQLAGDVDGDDVIDIYDVAVILQFLGAKAEDGRYGDYLAQNADINRDGIVDDADLNFALHNYGKWNKAKLGRNGVKRIQKSLPNGLTLKEMINNPDRIPGVEALLSLKKAQ